MAKVKKKHLLDVGYAPGKALKAALMAMNHPQFQKQDRNTKLDLLQKVLTYPERFVGHPILGTTAALLNPEGEANTSISSPVLKSTPVDMQIFGQDGIEPGALQQMYTAAKLPIARAAALMPDAHQGYGLPIGGVLATTSAVIPYAVGVDIGCRMALSVYPLSSKYLEKHRRELTRILQEETTFGAGRGPENPMDDPVLEREEFQTLPIVKKLKDKAWRQIGSSGGGNHFVEFGEIDIYETDTEWDLASGTYLALLSHSGSRGLGAGIAQHYTRVAMETTRLPKVAKHLAWLTLDSDAGHEYWLAMNLAGDYASACHNHIHHRVSRALGEKSVIRIENHHNFAWKEQLPNGEAVIVHRKGATPAAAGVLGIIPGSMTAPGFIVRGKGHGPSLNSASHGAGRVLSRSKAKNSITRHALNKLLKEARITLIGGGLDEAPIAYKDIHGVMARQKELIEVLGKFQPRIVRMDG